MSCIPDNILVYICITWVSSINQEVLSEFQMSPFVKGMSKNRCYRISPRLHPVTQEQGLTYHTQNTSHAPFGLLNRTATTTWTYNVVLASYADSFKHMTLQFKMVCCHGNQMYRAFDLTSVQYSWSNRPIPECELQWTPKLTSGFRVSCESFAICNNHFGKGMYRPVDHVTQLI